MRFLLALLFLAFVWLLFALVCLVLFLPYFSGITGIDIVLHNHEGTGLYRERVLKIGETNWRFMNPVK